MRNVKLEKPYKQSKKCECCGEYRYNVFFFKWYSLVTDDYLCTICFKCAKKELFGNKIKKNDRYDKWLEEIKKA